jgi:hypothetical protein
VTASPQAGAPYKMAASLPSCTCVTSASRTCIISASYAYIIGASRTYVISASRAGISPSYTNPSFCVSCADSPSTDAS